MELRTIGINVETQSLQKFQNFISLGYFCDVAKELEKLGLRSFSGPFDWNISSLNGVISAIENNFEGYLDYDCLQQNKYYRKRYKNVRYDIAFFHDFSAYRSLASQIESVKDKYNRRIDKFYRVTEKPTLFIRYIIDNDELLYISENIDRIESLIKSRNPDSDILFITSLKSTPNTIRSYFVAPDQNDVVSRHPITDNPVLRTVFSSIDIPEKELNLRFFAKKDHPSLIDKSRKYLPKIIDKLFREEYHHNSTYE